MGGTHIRIGGVRIDLRFSGTIKDAADLLGGVTRASLRSIIADPVLREEAIRRVLSPPCAVRCFVSKDGTRHDCNCPSGFQYSSDPEQQALEGCPARDVWSDLRSLLKGHHEAGRGADDPIVADCDDLTPSTLAVAAYIAWFAPKGYAVNGFELGAWRRDEERFASAITLPPDKPGAANERVAHAYGLVSKPPPAPQPRIAMVDKEGRRWFVWDASAHFGMKRPPDSYYVTGEIAGFEIHRENLEGLQLQAA